MGIAHKQTILIFLDNKKHAPELTNAVCSFH